MARTWLRLLAAVSLSLAGFALAAACGGDDDPIPVGTGDASADGGARTDASPTDGGPAEDGGADAGRCVVNAAGATTIVDALEVSIGTMGACILRQGSAIVCRGSNPNPNPFPASAGAVNVVRLQVGSGFACALDDASRVWCWGSNSGGRIGATPDGGVTLDPVLLAKADGPLVADDMAVSFNAGCAIEHGTRAVYCWGSASSGELGEVDGGPSGVVVPPRPNGIVASPNARFTRPGLSVGQCLIDGPALTCWGLNGAKQFASDAGTPTTTTAIPAIAAAAGATLPFADYSMSLSHACAVDAKGSVYCWGASTPSACGSLAVGDEKVTVVPELGTSGARVASGAFHTCVVDKDAHLKCFGNQNFGILGNGDTSGTGQAVPQTVRGLDGGGALEKVGRAYTGAVQMCAILEGSCGPNGPGPVYCWGNNSAGVLGNPDAGLFPAFPVPQLLP